MHIISNWSENVTFSQKNHERKKRKQEFDAYAREGETTQSISNITGSSSNLSLSHTPKLSIYFLSIFNYIPCI